MALQFDEPFQWRQLAACRGPHHASVFFPPTRTERREEKREREKRAKAICNDCVVHVDCLEYALHIREQHGIWGGLNELERREILMSRPPTGSDFREDTDPWPDGTRPSQER